MKTMRILLGVAALVTGTHAQALMIMPDDCSINSGSIACVVDTTPGGNISDTDLHGAFVSLGLTGMQELYKDNVGGVEEGSLAGSYDTTYTNTPLDPSDAWIEFTGGDFVSCLMGCAALVKDGNQLPGWYIYDLTGLWDGTEDLHFENFWPDRGAMSHISLYGTSENVPEPGILALLGIGFLGIGLRRYIKAVS